MDIFQEMLEGAMLIVQIFFAATSTTSSLVLLIMSHVTNNAHQYITNLDRHGCEIQSLLVHIGYSSFLSKQKCPSCILHCSKQKHYVHVAPTAQWCVWVFVGQTVPNFWSKTTQLFLFSSFFFSCHFYFSCLLEAAVSCPLCRHTSQRAPLSPPLPFTDKHTHTHTHLLTISHLCHLLAEYETHAS